MKPSFTVTWLLAIFLVLFGSLIAFAQTETGTIKGTVADTTGAVVPSAKVTATSTTNGSIRSTVSNADGLFAITNLQPGLYDVKIEAQGFASVVRKVQVTVGARIGV